jgi:hypothetical protein
MQGTGYRRKKLEAGRREEWRVQRTGEVVGYRCVGAVTWRRRRKLEAGGRKAEAGLRVPPQALRIRHGEGDGGLGRITDHDARGVLEVIRANLP